MRKSSAKKISGKSENKARKAKIKVVPGVSGETITKKEGVKKVKPKTAAKTKSKAEIKVGAKAVAKKEKISAVPLVPTIKGKEKKKTKKVPKTPASESKRKSGQIRMKAFPEKEETVSLPTSKKGPAKQKRAAKAVTKADADNKKKTKEKSAKPARKISALVREKFPVGKVKEIEIKKPADRKRKKPGVAIEVKQMTTGKYEKAVKNLARETFNKLNTKKFTELPEKKVKSVFKKKRTVRSAAREKNPAIPQEILPSEYGENGITLMPVDPHKLFVFWEMRQDTLERYEGEPTIRVYDVDGIVLNDTGNAWFDIGVSERIGSRYIDVCPDREFIADFGIIYEGIFIAVARSRKVSTPGPDITLKSESPQKLHETGTRVGY
jgi:hypothetical protein